jgi:uncharacterized protein (DUF2126 family)
VEPLPPQLEDKRRALARALGRPVVIRGIRTPDPDFRGRLRVEPHRVLIEYQVAQAGYFWHLPIIEELLARAADGESQAELREAGGEPTTAGG